MNKQDNLRQATLYAYMAGIIDGEGSIGINRVKPPNPKWNYAYHARIGLGNTSYKVIKLFSDTFGGAIFSECVVFKGRKMRPMHRWGKVGSPSTLVVLETLYPYLLIKKGQAKIVIDFCKKKQTIGFIRNQGLPKKQIQWRERIWLKVKSLNLIGAAAETNQEDMRKHKVIVRTIQ